MGQEVLLDFQDIEPLPLNTLWREVFQATDLTTLVIFVTTDLNATQNIYIRENCVLLMS